tara:strand:- start:293 stop:484 length:192 start_codon:yes stop_codon:yes gene_type:complete
MGCGCKNKKKKAAALKSVGEPNAQEDIMNRKSNVQSQVNYQTRVQEALKQLMELKQRKQNLRK